MFVEMKSFVAGVCVSRDARVLTVSILFSVYYDCNFFNGSFVEGATNRESSRSYRFNWRNYRNDVYILLGCPAR